MRIAVEGCAHGELNKIYESIRHIETRENWKVDLLICCGDFQSVRDHNDMLSMAVPKKYMEMKDFCDYYTGKRIAPILTLFIGGNHEASNYLWELPYGGWVAENIYYLGYSGVVNFGGIRIGGISGIFKKKDYYAERSESPPFNENTKRSIYHVRKRDVEILKLLRDDPPDIFLSHDWPTNIYNYGNVEQLLRFKPFLKEEIEANTLGNEGAEEILNVLQPAYWFSGHMHAKFAALVQHPSGKQTKFLALDKCLPRRNFLQILDFGQAKGEAVLKYDINWLGILKTTSKVMSILELNNEHKPSEEILDQIRDSCTSFEVLPFSKSFNGNNTQTLKFCEMFDLANPCITKSWNTIKKSVVDNAYRSRPKPKMSLPQPGEKKAVPKSENSLKDKKQEKDDDEFGEITNPNMLSNVSDSDDAEESNGSSSGSSSSSSDDDDDRKSSSDRGSDNDNRKYESFEKYERNTAQSPPSFIETPQNVKTINSRLSMQSDISTPFKWKSESNNMRNKTLSFNVSPLREKTTDFEYTSPTSDSAKIAIDKNLNIEKSASSTPTQIVPEGEVTCDGGSSLASHLTPSPKKKFKLIRRNQSIYTPSKEEE